LKTETGLPVIPVGATESKIARAESVTGIFEAGKVLLPPHDPAWLEPFIQEHLRFPGGKNDDQVDSSAHALRHLRGLARTRGGGVAGVVVYDAYGNLVGDSVGSIEEPLTPQQAWELTGWRDPLCGSADEYEDAFSLDY
jgi:hypothetical protein